MPGSTVTPSSTATAAVGAQDGITAETLVSLKRVTQAVLDPAGERVAYTLSVPRGPDDDPGGAWSELWVMELSSGEARRFTAPESSATSPAWSPDGERISFLARRGSDGPNTQVWAISLHGGEARPLTEHETSVAAYRWSPDGRHIAFVAVDPLSDEEKEAQEEGRDWTVVGEGLKQRRLWVVDVEADHSHALYEAELSTWSFDWTPDGRSLVFQASETPRVDDSYMFTDLYRVDLHGGEARKIADTEGKLGPPAVSPDGSRVGWLGAVSLNDPLAQSVWVAPLDGGTPRNLTPGAELSGTQVEWLDDGTLLLLAQEGTGTTLSRLEVASGDRTSIGTGETIFQSIDAHPEAGRLVAVAHTAAHPQELYAATVDGDELSRLTHSNPVLDDIALGSQETIEWSAPDGWRIEGVLTYPLGYREGTRYPLVLQVHGGPEGVSLDGWTTSATYPVQLLAANGYVVLEPNYRGSGGRGVAFAKADHDDLGGKEFEDVLAGIDALAARGLVDPERVGTGGWSYGGYFSAWAATRHSERFKAAVVAAGLTNWVSFTGTTDIPYEMSLVHWNQWWFDDPELHWMRSPLAHIGTASTPTLIVHGSADERVHPEQSLELYTALRIKGVPTELVLYPRQPHGLVERAHQLDFAERVLAWFDRWLK